MKEKYFSNNTIAASFNVTHIGFTKYYVTNLDEAKKFYVDVVGFYEVECIKNKIYLGGYEERNKFSFILEKAEKSGLACIGFHVADEDDLDKIARLYGDHGYFVKWNGVEEMGLGKNVLVQDFSGIPIVFYHEMEQREWLMQKFSLYRGARPLRIDHVNIMVPDAQKVADWWREKLGFYTTEYTLLEKDDPRLSSIWLTRKQSVHDIALTTGDGPRMHHTAFYVSSEADISRALDNLGEFKMGHLQERGPLRHGISNAFANYLRDPFGNRIELFTGDYMIPDLKNWTPKEWFFDDPQRATFWGQYAPASWFDEAMPVEDIKKPGEFMPLEKTTLRHKPKALEENKK